MDITEDELNAFFESVGNLKEDPSNPFAKKKPAAAKPVAEQPATPSPVPQEPVQPETTPTPEAQPVPEIPSFMVGAEIVEEEPVTVVPEPLPTFMANAEIVEGTPAPVSTPVETPAVTETVDPNMTNEYLDYAAEQSAKPKTPMEVKEAADKFMADNGINPTEYVGDKPMYVLVEEAIRTGDSTIINNLMNAPLFGFGPKIVGLTQGKAAGEEVKKLEELRAQMNPEEALAGSIIGSVAGPGLGVGALTAKGIQYADEAAKGMGFIGRNLTKLAGRTLPGAAGGALVGGLSAVGNDTNPFDGALMGAGIGAVAGPAVATAGLLGKGYDFVKEFFSPSAQASAKKVVKKIADDTGRSVEEVQEAVLKNKDMIEIMDSFGIDPFKSGGLISKITNDIATPSGAAKVTNEINEYLNKVEGEARDRVSDFRAPLTVRTAEGKDSLGEEISDAYAKMDPSKVKEVMAEFVEKTPTYAGSALARAISQRVNANPAKHIAASGRKGISVEGDDIQIIKGTPYILKSDAKKLTDKELEDLSKEDIVTFKGLPYNKKDMFEIENVDGGVLNSALGELNNMTGDVFKSGNVQAGIDTFKPMSDELKDITTSKSTDVAEALFRSSKAKGTLGISKAANELLSNRAPDENDIEKFLSKIDKEKRIDNVSEDDIANAVRASIDDLISSGKGLGNMMANGGKTITNHHRKVLETAGLSADEIAETEKLAQRLSTLGQIESRTRGTGLSEELQAQMSNIAISTAMGAQKRAGYQLANMLKTQARRKVDDEVVEKIMSLDPVKFQEFVKLLTTNPTASVMSVLQKAGAVGAMTGAAINAQ